MRFRTWKSTDGAVLEFREAKNNAGHRVIIRRLRGTKGNCVWWGGMCMSTNVFNLEVIYLKLLVPGES